MVDGNDNPLTLPTAALSKIFNVTGLVARRPQREFAPTSIRL
jgi:hypothetical protein